jgi:hypothetical protein
VVNGPALSVEKTKGDCGSCSRRRRRKARNSRPARGWTEGEPFLARFTTVGEVHRVPPERHQLGRSNAVPVGHQYHGRVAVAVTVIAGGGRQPIDLGIGEVLARAKLGDLALDAIILAVSRAGLPNVD